MNIMVTTISIQPCPVKIDCQFCLEGQARAIAKMDYGLNDTREMYYCTGCLSIEWWFNTYAVLGGTPALMGLLESSVRMIAESEALIRGGQ